MQCYIRTKYEVEQRRFHQKVLIGSSVCESSRCQHMLAVISAVRYQNINIIKIWCMIHFKGMILHLHFFNSGYAIEFFAIPYYQFLYMNQGCIVGLIILVFLTSSLPFIWSQIIYSSIKLNGSQNIKDW